MFNPESRVRYFKKIHDMSLDRHGDDCILRIDSIKLIGTGYAGKSSRISGFDLELYAAPTTHTEDIQRTEQRNSSFKKTLEPHANAFVECRAAINVEDERNQFDNFEATMECDFNSNIVSGKPTISSVKNIKRSDIYLRNKETRLILAGWSLWGSDCYFQFNAIGIHVVGRKLCGVWSSE